VLDLGISRRDRSVLLDLTSRAHVYMQPSGGNLERPRYGRLYVIDMELLSELPNRCKVAYVVTAVPVS
jgi:hypothetical protein